MSVSSDNIKTVIRHHERDEEAEEMPKFKLPGQPLVKMPAPVTHAPHCVIHVVLNFLS